VHRTVVDTAVASLIQSAMLETQSTTSRDAAPEAGLAQPPRIDADNVRTRGKDRGDLWYLESTAVPRPDDVCERFAAKIEPWWGFAVYGALYMFPAFVLAGMATLPVFLLGHAVGAKGATWVNAIALVVALAAFSLAWWPFARWIQRRRRAALPLVRDGELVTGVVADKYAGPVGQVAKRVAADLAVGRTGMKFYRVQLSHAGEQYLLQVPIAAYSVPAVGTPVTVLYRPSAPYALVIDPVTNKATPVRVR
jgi:hypothetical protein